MRRYPENDWNPDKRTESIREALPFVGLLVGLAALIGGLIWLIETFGKK